MIIYFCKGWYVWLCGAILLCLNNTSCHNGKGKGEFEQFFAKVELPSIPLEVAMKSEWIEMSGYFVDENDKVVEDQILVKLLSDQIDSERGVPVIMNIPGSLFSQKSIFSDDYDIPNIRGAGYFKDNQLKIYEAYPIEDENMNPTHKNGLMKFNIGDYAKCGYDDESLLMMDLKIDDFSQIYGFMNYPLIEKGDSVIRLAFSIHEVEKVGPRLIEATPFTIYSSQHSGEFHIALIPIPTATDYDKVIVTGSWLCQDDPKDRPRIESFTEVLNENNEFFFNILQPVRWTPNTLYREIPLTGEVIEYKRTKHGITWTPTSEDIRQIQLEYGF